MWKLLRNLVIVALLCVVALKLLLWYEVQQGAARLTARLAPAAQVQYGSVAAGLDGGVDLSQVTVSIAHDRVHEVWRASQVGIGTPGALWLLRRLLSGDDSFPEHLAITVKGLQVPAAAFGTGTAALNPLSLVPFETLGCGIVSRFSVADYQRMGLNPGVQQQRLEYRYDPAAATLTLIADLASPPFSAINLRTELQKFDPRQFVIGGWQKLHVGEVSVTYGDSGYLAKRNRFCAQQAAISPAAFLDQHVAAVEALLNEHGVQPSPQVTGLYRSLVGEGGRISVLSLPPAASTVGQLLAETPDVMTRQLNLTARRNDAPPVMVRLGFVAPETTPSVADAEPTPATASEMVKAPPPPAPIVASPKAAPTVPSAPIVKAVPPPVTAKPPAPAKPSAPQSAPAAAASTAPVAIAATSAGKPPPPAPSPAPPGPAAAKADSASAADALPSGPPPPEGSTLALVWKPTVDRLQQGAPAARDYDVIEYSALHGYAGRYVRLLTKTGKKVEGRVIGVDDNSVGMRIQQPGGVAELQVPRSVIVEIQVPHHRPADDKG